MPEAAAREVILFRERKQDIASRNSSGQRHLRDAPGAASSSSSSAAPGQLHGSYLASGIHDRLPHSVFREDDPLLYERPVWDTMIVRIHSGR